MTFRASARRRHFPVRLRSWRFTRCPSSSLSDSITKIMVRALALRRCFPIRLRRWCFELCPSLALSDQVTNMMFRPSALCHHFPIRLRRWRFEREPFVVSFRLDYEDDGSSISPSLALSDQVTMMMFRPSALCHHFPIRLRSWPFEHEPFVVRSFSAFTSVIWPFMNSFDTKS